MTAAEAFGLLVSDQAEVEAWRAAAA